MSSNPNAPSPDQEQARTFAVAIILIALFFAAMAMLQEEMSAFAGAFAYLHVYPVGKMVSALPFLRDVPVIGPGFFAKVELAKLFLDQGNFAYMSPEQRRDVLTAAGLVAMPVYLPFMIYAGIKGRSFRPDVAFRNAYSLDHMIWVQSEHWLTSRGARHVNPLKIPEVSAGSLARQVVENTERRSDKVISCGLLIEPAYASATPSAWNRAMRPEEWLVAKGLCISEKHVGRAREKEWKYPDRLLESREAWHDLTLDTLMETLSGQLQHPWKGFGNLRPCQKALCAVFSLFYDYDINGGNTLLNDLGALFDAIKAKPRGMDDAILAEEGLMARIEGVLSGKAGKNMLEIADRHAWQETAFPAMLTYARKDRGVLPAAAFLWLKAEDRKLWYIMDNVGSEAVMIEAAGAMSHFRAESQIGKPIHRPAVYQAARALLEDYLDMTEERIASRADKEERGRSAGQKIDLLLGKEI